MESGEKSGERLNLPADRQQEGKQRGSSRFNLFVNGRGKVELSESLPFLRSADAVVGQLLHGHPVDAFRVPDPVVHLQKATTASGSKVGTRAASLNTVYCSILWFSLVKQIFGLISSLNSIITSFIK